MLTGVSSSPGGGPSVWQEIGGLDERERAWGAAAVEPAAEAPAHPPLHREVGRGASRVRCYYDPDDVGERTVGRHGGERMGLNPSHPARHGGL